MPNIKIIPYALLAVLWLLPGCGGGGGGAAGPTISGVTVTPGRWSSGGGTATITATVGDSRAITSVRATVTLAGGTGSAIALRQQAWQVVYQGEFTVPANHVVGGPAESYSVVVTATNDAGKSSSSSAVRFSVPSPTSPPGPPN